MPFTATPEQLKIETNMEAMAENLKKYKRLAEIERGYRRRAARYEMAAKEQRKFAESVKGEIFQLCSQRERLKRENERLS